MRMRNESEATATNETALPMYTGMYIYILYYTYIHNALCILSERTPLDVIV